MKWPSFIAVSLLTVLPSMAGELLTRAEASDYKATSSHAEVLAFCEALAAESDRVVLKSMGTSNEDRDLPLLVLSESGVSGPDGRFTVLLLGNIHAGEVCGKEALLMLARQWARAEDAGLLKDITVLVAPIYNADGNEAMALDNRPGQLGPERGMGQRANAQGLDLNRDYVKAEAPETRALLKLFREWDPEMVIDTHTTNGSHHRYTLTYGGPRHPNTDPRLVGYLRDKFLPKVTQRLDKRDSYSTFFYGNFTQDHQRWETYPALPRYGAHYLGFRQRLGILSEAYAYAPYRDRVLATRDFVQTCLDLAVAQREKISDIVAKAQKRPNAGDAVVLRQRLSALPGKRVVHGYVEENGEVIPQKKDYLVDYWGGSSPTLEVALPYAYLIAAEERETVELLQRHGIEVEVLREDLLLNVSCQRALSLDRAERAFQGHHLVTVDAVVLAREERLVPAGTLVVFGEQRLGKLASYLLEPQAEDGLVTWGVLSPEDGGEFPVLRIEPQDQQALLTTAARPLAEDRRMGRRVTFGALYGEEMVDFNGSTTSVRWLDDGESFLQRRGGKLHRVEALTGRSEPLLSEKRIRRSLKALPELDADEVKSIAGRSSWTMNPDRTGGLLQHRDDLYHVSFEGKPARRLTATPGKEELATYSPDGAFVAFVRDGNLYVSAVDSGRERALTTDGGGMVRNGKADWVYFEELYGRSWKAYWWSPDSRHLAFHRFDSSRLPTFHALNTLPLHGELTSMPHPKPGDPNPEVQLGMVHVAGGEPAWVDFSEYTEGAYLVSHVGWCPHGDSIYYYVQDRAQTWLDFLTCSRSGGEGTHWFRDQTEAWVEHPGECHWLGEDGKELLFLSERSGWRHLYRANAEGNLSPVTHGEWEVRRVHHVDASAKMAYFSATKDSPIAENLYRVSWEDEPEVKRLTEREGAHRVQVSQDARYFVDTWSDWGTPPQVHLHEISGGKVRTLDANPVYALEEFALGEAQHHQIPTKDGFLLEAVVTKPVDFDASKRYPVWLRTYAGPQAPSVRRGWGRSGMLEQMLAEMGMIVFRLDPRSASGKGACSAWTAYRQLGVQELVDLEEGLDWIGAHPYVDAERIGMHGHSYGGFMTAYAMTHSTRFAAGISGAPVTDWRYYDTIYTERYMNTPQENPTGYAKTSVVEAAGDLHGRLLLLHGIMDDNVHLQNSTQLIKALQDANKDFRLMLYPTMKHGLYGDHYQKLLVDFIRETLLCDEH